MPAEPLKSQGTQRLGLIAAARNTVPGATSAYELIRLFTTQSGRWDSTGMAYDLPHWARDAYLKSIHHPQHFDDAGGDHHLFARVEDEQGNPIPTKIRFWSRDGQHIECKSTGDKKSGWASIPIWASFNPERGERGPWLWGPDGALAVADGGGLPNNLHVSSFAVWRRVAVTAEPTTHWRPVKVGEITYGASDGWMEFHCSCGHKWGADEEPVTCICGKTYRVRHYLEIKE